MKRALYFTAMLVYFPVVDIQEEIKQRLQPYLPFDQLAANGYGSFYWVRVHCLSCMVQVDLVAKLGLFHLLKKPAPYYHVDEILLYR